MKVLIVDDNEAIQEILSEILSVDGYDTVAVSSIDSAIDDIKASVPDAILLESTVGGESGLEMIDMMASEGHPLSNVIVIVSGNEQIPKDSVSIVGVIHKPFKSVEVLDMLRKIFSDMSKEKPKTSIFKALFGKKVEDRTEEGISIKFGKSYLFVEDAPDNSYKVASQLSAEGYDLMVITSGKIKAARERISDPDKVIGLSGKEGSDYIEPDMLGSIMGSISDFISENEKPVVLLDDLDHLIERNDLNSVLTMIHQVINDQNKLLTLIVSARSKDMTEKDRELLQNSMDIRIFGD